MQNKIIAEISAAVFIIIALLHLLRLVLNLPAIISNYEVPLWVSMIIVIIAGYLAYENWKASK